jgi:hypothetical protein
MMPIHVDEMLKLTTEIIFDDKEKNTRGIYVMN